MPHISNLKLSDKELAKLRVQFFEVLLETRVSSKKHKKALESLFTDTEKIMLSKRLSAIVLMESGMSSYKVRELLNLSSSTVARLKLGIEIGRYKELTGMVVPKRKTVQSKVDMEKLIRGGLPEMGKGRWDWLDN